MLVGGGVKSASLADLCDLDAERAVLGNALLEATAVPLVSDVPAGLYHQDWHRAVAEAIQGLARRGETVEPGTLQAELERRGRWVDVGPTRLALLEESATVATSLPSYIAKVRDYATRRELVRLARGAGHAAADLTTPVEHVLAQHTQALATLEEHGVPHEILGPVAVAAEMRTLTEISRITTGLAVYDLEGGLSTGDLHALAARTRLGKTSAGLQVAHHVATILGLPTLFCSLEMSRYQILLRLRHLASPDEIEASEFRIVDPIGITAPDVASIVRRSVARDGTRMAIVDHLQRIKPDPGHRFARRDLEIRDICETLANTARATGIAILALCQINREGAHGAKGENAVAPALETVQDGGAIEQESASVTLLYSDPPGTEDSDAAAIAVTFAQRKNRHGQPRRWRARFLRPYRFEGV